MTTSPTLVDGPQIGPVAAPALWMLNSLVVERATSAATGGAFTIHEMWTTPAGNPPPHVHHDHACVVVELHALDDRVLQPQQGTPYPCFLHAALRSRFQVLDSPKSIARAACTYFTAASQHPRMRQEIPFPGHLPFRMSVLSGAASGI